RAELRRRADRRVQGFGHPEAGAFHGGEVEGDRFWSVPVDDVLQPRAQVVEANVPRGVLQPPVHSHPRAFETVWVVVHLAQRTALLAGVTVRERVVLVAADANHLVTLDVDEDAADG